MLCLATAATTVMLLTGSITLSWDHSVEKTHWQEHYQIADNQLHLVAASVQGSGAGMEPPPGARLNRGAWHWQPDLWLEQLTLASSEFTGDYTLCLDSGLCRPLGHWLPPGHSVTLIPCAAPEAH